MKRQGKKPRAKPEPGRNINPKREEGRLRYLEMKARAKRMKAIRQKGK